MLNFPVIKEVVQYAREKEQQSRKRIHFSITTNGTLFSEVVNRFLNENKFSVVISFDGDLAMQNKNRPFKRSKRSHEITKKRIEEFLESRGGNATGRATITAYNADLKRVRDSLMQMGFKRVEMTEASPPNLTAQAGNNRIQPSFVINTSQRKAMLEDLEEQAKETLKAVKERKHTSTSKILGIIRLLYSKRKRRYFCGVGRGLVGISISGDIYPCHRFVGIEDLKMGNINEFDGGCQKACIKNTLRNYGVMRPRCRECWARYFCGGGCMYESIQANGSETDPDENWCRELRRSVELGIAVYDQLDGADREYIRLMESGLDDRRL